jgi:predicted oxidoreductase
VGTTTPERLRAAAGAARVRLEAADWYRLFEAATAHLP